MAENAIYLIFNIPAFVQHFTVKVFNSISILSTKVISINVANGTVVMSNETCTRDSRIETIVTLITNDYLSYYYTHTHIIYKLQNIYYNTWSKRISLVQFKWVGF